MTELDSIPLGLINCEASKFGNDGMSSKFKYMASKFSKCNEQCSGGPQEKIQAGPGVPKIS